MKKQWPKKKMAQVQYRAAWIPTTFTVMWHQKLDEQEDWTQEVRYLAGHKTASGSYRVGGLDDDVVTMPSHYMKRLSNVKMYDHNVLV